MRFALVLLFLAQSVAAQTATLAVTGGRILDGYGGPPIENGVILIAGERITAVGPASAIQVPSGIRVIDANGMTVMPGLIDMHVHLQILGHGDYKRWNDLYGTRNAELVMPIAARQLLGAGVTSARDLGAPLEHHRGQAKDRAQRNPRTTALCLGSVHPACTVRGIRETLPVGCEWRGRRKVQSAAADYRRRRRDQVDRPGPDDRCRGGRRRTDGACSRESRGRACASNGRDPARTALRRR